MLHALECRGVLSARRYPSQLADEPVQECRLALEVERRTTRDICFAERTPIRFGANADEQVAATIRMEVQARLKSTVRILRAKLAKFHVIGAAVQLLLEAV